METDMGAGRPRSFDIEKALEAALGVFLEKGYEGAYLGDLTRAMGINSPSLYAAFGSKEGLFRQVLDRYRQERDSLADEALAAPTAYETVERLLLGSAVEQTRADRAPGCLLVQGALVCADQVEPVREELNRCRQTGQLALAERFSRAKASGELPAAADPDALARYVHSVLFGIAVLAAGGATRAELQETANLTMRAWQGMFAG
jgi:AcrR family transcriptional regulator